MDRGIMGRATATTATPIRIGAVIIIHIEFAPLRIRHRLQGDSQDERGRPTKGGLFYFEKSANWDFGRIPPLVASAHFNSKPWPKRSNRTLPFTGSTDQPFPFVDIEFQGPFIPHFQ
jgi:hypothetical protein